MDKEKFKEGIAHLLKKRLRAIMDSNDSEDLTPDLEIIYDEYQDIFFDIMQEIGAITPDEINNE